MKRGPWLLFGSLVVAFVLSLAFQVGTPQAAYQNGPQVVRWEYRLVSIAEGVREFNNLGAEGWEVCAAMGAGQPQGVLVFKRPLP